MSGIIKQIDQVLSAIPGLDSFGARRFALACGFFCAIAAGGWAFLNPGNWTASQSLVVRDDLLGDSFKPGRFNSLESMKAAQETIFHIARKPEVIRAAVRESGQSAELSSEDIEKYQRWISIVAPNGGEFGKTEVFVVRVKETSPERAQNLIQSLSSEIESHVRVVRTNMMASMQAELASNVARTSEHYNELVREIQNVEQSVGADLASLRGLIDPNSGAGDLQRSLEQIRLEIRGAQNDRERIAKQLELIRLAMQQTADDYLTTSNDLLELQPVLKRLHDGLIDARLALSVAMGKYDSGHPLLENAKTAAIHTMDQIRSVLDSTEKGLVSQLGLYEQKVVRLSGDEQKCADRLIDLGKLRVTYKSLSDELTKRGEALAKTRTELAEIQALAESAGDVSLITRIGEPQLGTRPDGISKRAMVLAGLLGGLMIGLGLVVLNANPVSPKLAGASRPADHNTQSTSPVASTVPSGTPQVFVTEPAPSISAIPAPLMQPPSPSPIPASAIAEQQSGKQSQQPVTPEPKSKPDLPVQRPVAQQPALKPLQDRPREQKPFQTIPAQDRPQPVSSSGVPPAVLPGQMIPNTSMRPTNILKSVDIAENDARRSARMGSAESTVKSGELRQEDIGALALPVSIPSHNDPSNKLAPGADRSVDLPGDPESAGNDKSGANTVRSAPTLRASELNHDQTVSMADLQLQNIRRELKEMDPSISFDVFCESVRKEVPPQDGNS